MKHGNFIVNDFKLRKNKEINATIIKETNHVTLLKSKIWQTHNKENTFF